MPPFLFLSDGIFSSTVIISFIFSKREKRFPLSLPNSFSSHPSLKVKVYSRLMTGRYLPFSVSCLPPSASFLTEQQVKNWRHQWRECHSSCKTKKNGTLSSLFRPKCVFFFLFPLLLFFLVGVLSIFITWEMSGLSDWKVSTPFAICNRTIVYAREHLLSYSIQWREYIQW